MLIQSFIHCHCIIMNLDLYTLRQKLYKKRKKAVGGRLGMFGSLTLFSFLAFFAFGPIVVVLFLCPKKITNQNNNSDKPQSLSHKPKRIKTLKITFQLSFS